MAFRNVFIIGSLLASSCAPSAPVEQAKPVAEKPQEPSKLSAFSESLGMSASERRTARLADMDIEIDGAFAVVETQTSTHERYKAEFAAFLDGTSKYDYDKILENLVASQTAFYERIDKLIEEDEPIPLHLPHDIALLENMNCMSILIIAEQDGEISEQDRDAALEAHVKDAISQTVSQVDVDPEQVYVLHRINHNYWTSSFRTEFEPDFANDLIRQCVEYEKLDWSISQIRIYEQRWIIP